MACISFSVQALSLSCSPPLASRGPRSVRFSRFSLSGRKLPGGLHLSGKAAVPSVSKAAGHSVLRLRAGAEQFVEDDRDDSSKILSQDELEKVLEDVADQLEHSAEALRDTVQHAKETQDTSAYSNAPDDVNSRDASFAEGSAMVKQGLEPNPGAEEGYEEQWEMLGYEAAGQRVGGLASSGPSVSQTPGTMPVVRGQEGDEARHDASVIKAMTVGDVSKARARQAHAYVGDKAGPFVDEQTREAERAFELLKESSAEDTDYVGSVVDQPQRGAAEGVEDAQWKAGETRDYLGEKAEDAKEGVKGAAGTVENKAAETKDYIGDKAVQTKDYVGEKAEQTADYIGDKAGDIKEKAVETKDHLGEKAEQTADYVGDKAGDIKKKAIETKDYLGEKAEQTVDYIGDKAEETRDYVGEKVEDTQEAAGGVWGSVVDEFEGAGQRTADNITSSVQQAKDALGGVFGAVLGATEDAGGTVKDAAHDARERLESGSEEGYEGEGEKEEEGSGAQWKGSEGAAAAPSLTVSEGEVSGGTGTGEMSREDYAALQTKADEEVRGALNRTKELSAEEDKGRMFRDEPHSMS